LELNEAKFQSEAHFEEMGDLEWKAVQAEADLYDL